MSEKGSLDSLHKGTETRRSKVVFAILVGTVLVLASLLTVWWVKEESVRVDILYDEPVNVTVSIDGRVLASESLDPSGHPVPIFFSCSTVLAKGSHTVNVTEEITGAGRTVRIEVYWTLYVIADIHNGNISFQVTSSEPLYM